jgi:CheY-like chemotaxis protein
MSMSSSSEIAVRLSASPVAVFVIGDQSAILHGNPAAGLLLGCEPADVVGHSLDIPHSIYEEREVEMVCAGSEVRRVRIVTRQVDWDGAAAFEIELHVLEASAPAPVPAPVPPPPASAAPAGQRILILEDDLSIGDIQCRMLKTLGYVTVWTKLGEDAITKCEEAVGRGENFAAALLDLTIHGGMGGREVARHLKKIDPDLKSIACSGYSDDELNKELLKEGFVDILPKPFRAQELGKILKKNLG